MASKADTLKNEGNVLYKARNFEEALAKYDEAIAEQPHDAAYHNNKAAVLIEMGRLEDAKKVLNDVVENRYTFNRENPDGASYTKMAKVFKRLSSIANKEKNFEDAIEYLKKALLEDNDRFTRNDLRELEKAKLKYEKDLLIDPALAETLKEEANALFKKQDYAGAKKIYDDAILRNPSDPKLYSNRAASFTKLMAYPDALTDLEVCLKLDPNFVKAYSRKGTCHYMMKEYTKAEKAYEAGLAIDPSNQECLNGLRSVKNQVRGNMSKEVDEEQVQRAMADPDIQAIMRDPNTQLFLKEVQENPANMQARLSKDPAMAKNIEKLMTAGIIRMGP